MRSREKGVFLALACATFAAALGAFVFFSGVFSPPGPPGGTNPARLDGAEGPGPAGLPGRDRSGTEDLTAREAITLAHGAVARITFQYECGHYEVVSEPVADRFAGASREVFAAAYPGCELSSFSPGLVEMTEHLPGMAPSCSASTFVGVSGGRVAVFYGTPARPCRVRRVTDIDVSQLPPQEAADVRSGIQASGDAEVLSILEGLGER